MVSVCVLASGSRGNSIYVSDGCTAVLLDAGLSGVEIQRRMENKGLDPRSLSAIVVTHEHSDHIKGVGVLSRRFNIPVYINHGTKCAAASLGRLSQIRFFKCGKTFRVGLFFLQPFSVSHDATDPVGFVLIKENIKIGIATDLGIVTSLVRERISGCSLLILEANHDTNMLVNGSYPWHLKQRIKGRHGHLSNDTAAQLIRDVCHVKLKHVILAHLSNENNTEAKAFEQVNPALSSCDACLHVASQELGSDLFLLR